jgi:hypothetical protein
MPARQKMEKRERTAAAAGWMALLVMLRLRKGECGAAGMHFWEQEK